MMKHGVSFLRARVALLTTVLGLAALLALGSSKMGGSKSKPPPPPAPPPGQPPAGQPPVGAQPPGAAAPSPVPPPAKLRPPMVVMRPYKAPRIPKIYRKLPGGISHGYYWLIRGARGCSVNIPRAPFQECSVNRGRLIGCGARAARYKSLPLCVRGVRRRCSTGSDGRVTSCRTLFSGWSTTFYRGLYRVCCFRAGRLVTCTNSTTYICTYKDRRRLAAIRRRALARRLRAMRRPTYRRPTYRRPVRRPVRRRGAYYNCDIFNGRVGHCRGWYHGYAVVYYRGSYQRCRIFNGQVSHCKGWYKGRAPVKKGSVWNNCDIFNGRVGHCRGWYRGRAAVWK